MSEPGSAASAESGRSLVVVALACFGVGLAGAALWWGTSHVWALSSFAMLASLGTGVAVGWTARRLVRERSWRLGLVAGTACLLCLGGAYALDEYLTFGRLTPQQRILMTLDAPAMLRAEWGLPDERSDLSRVVALTICILSTLIAGRMGLPPKAVVPASGSIRDAATIEETADV